MKSIFSYVKIVGKAVLVNSGGCSCSEFYSECNLFCEFILIFIMIFVIKLSTIFKTIILTLLMMAKKKKSLAFG